MNIRKFNFDPYQSLDGDLQQQKPVVAASAGMASQSQWSVRDGADDYERVNAAAVTGLGTQLPCRETAENEALADCVETSELPPCCEATSGSQPRGSYEDYTPEPQKTQSSEAGTEALSL